MKYYWFAGNGMAARLDVGVGALIVLLLASVAGIPHSIQLLPILTIFGYAPLWVATPHIVWWLPIGSVSAVFPDLDIVWNILSRNKVDFNHHETPWHRPVVLLPLATLTAYMLFGQFFALVMFCGILWHYIHDTKGFGGGGITWFWPWSNMYWGLTGWVEPKDSDNEPDYYLRWLNQEPFTLIEISLGMLITWIVVWVILGFWLAVPLATFELLLFSFTWHYWVLRKAEEE